MTSKVLLLNPWGQPAKIIHWHDAIKMKYEGTADVVSEYEDIDVCSPSIEWKMPAVMRLKKLPKVGKRQIKFSRQNVYIRDRYRCQYCGDDKCPVEFLSYDHVIPRSKGGKTDWTNIVTSCKSCNCRKGDKSCAEAKMFPLKKPVKPKTLPFEPNIVDIERAPKEWLDYIN
jgi:5-methylcytosine-specific restriction endonuclease McrA